VSYEDAPTLRPQLQELLASALAERTAGDDDADASPLDPAAAVVRDDAATRRRLAALDGLTLHCRRVLDLGADLGDLARAARRAGAELVDAVEIDPARVELARLLCVLQDVDRVSWFEGDAGLGSTYADEYDVILAFGPALPAMRPILPRVVQNLRGVLLAELPPSGPAIDANDETLATVLPARATLAEPDEAGVVVVACASEEAVLRQHLAAERAEVGS
jgi:SAM-dependent methyltransferase